MFVGRTSELRILEKQYLRPGFSFPVIYGRRRMGKTRLIQEFIKGKPAIYFMATEQSPHEQLRLLTQAVKEQFPDQRTAMLDSFPDFAALFDYLALAAKEQRLIFVIDEYPYLARVYGEISSILQKYIDHKWQDTRLLLILCGSSMSFMERQVLNYQSPLYGRRTTQLKLQALPYYEAALFFPSWTGEEKLLAYGICDGTPQYLQYMARYENLTVAVCEELLSIGGRLQEEPQNLMLQEMREPAVYNSNLAAIAHGANRQNEIAMATGKEPTKLGFYLSNLQDLELIEKIQPLESKNARKGLYRIADNLYRFWYRFIPGCNFLIAMGLGRRAWQEKIRPSLDEYFGHVFENICLQYLQHQIKSGEIKELYTDFGSWWGNNPQKHRQEEIDIVCTNESHILCGECKWRREAVDADVLTLLEERAQLIAKGRKIHYYIFSKSGFTEKMKAAALTRGAVLVVVDDMVK